MEHLRQAAHPHTAKLIFRGMNKMYCVDGELNDKDRENSKFIFYGKGNHKKFEQAGFYIDRFRNDEWSYSMVMKLFR